MRRRRNTWRDSPKIRCLDSSYLAQLAILFKQSLANFSSELDAVVFIHWFGVVIELLAGNCLPYHQPCPLTYNPRKCWSLPGFSSCFEGGVFACTLSWGSCYRPPLFTPSFTRSIWCGRRASTVPSQGMNNQRTLNHAFSHALCPTDFWVWRSIGGLTSPFRPFQRVKDCVDFCFSWQRSHWSCQEWWCFWETCTMTTLADRKDTVKWVTFSTMKWPQCRVILVTKGPWVWIPCEKLKPLRFKLIFSMT